MHFPIVKLFGGYFPRLKRRLAKYENDPMSVEFHVDRTKDKTKKEYQVRYRLWINVSSKEVKYLERYVDSSKDHVLHIDPDLDVFTMPLSAYIAIKSSEKVIGYRINIRRSGSGSVQVSVFGKNTALQNVSSGTDRLGRFVGTSPNSKWRLSGTMYTIPIDWRPL